MDFISRSNGFDKRHSYLRETEVMIVDLDFYHPQMTRNIGFQYKEYIISIIGNYTERIHKGYYMDIFMYVGNIVLNGFELNLSDPIAKLTLVIVNKFN